MPAEMSKYEQRLHDRLSAEHRQIYSQLRGNIEEYLLDFIAMNIRYFTSHGKRHSLGVIKEMSLLLTDDVLGGLSSTEALVLLCAGWLHDVGLLVNRDPAGRILEYKEIRVRHAELGRDVILDTHIEAGIPDHELAALVAEVCYCHSRKVSIETRFPQARMPFDRDIVRPRFLAALLRLADALDVSQARAPERMMRKISEFPLDARLHWDICRVMHVNYDEEMIVVTATARTDEYQTAEDYRRLFYFKFCDLTDKLRGVRDILQEHSLPYRMMIGYLTFYPDDGSDRQIETVQGDAIPTNEVFPLEVILFEQMKRKHLEKEQYLFGADWDYQAARLYEDESEKSYKKTGVPVERADALSRAREHYIRAYELIRREINRQPPERYFLKTLETFFAIKVRRCANDTLTEGEGLFLDHLHQTQRALDQLEEHQVYIERGTHMLATFLEAGRSPLRPPIQKAIEAFRLRLENSPDGSLHHGCCECTARVITNFVLAGFSHEVERSAGWLQKKAEFHWRSIDSLTINKPVQMGHEYTADAMRAFLEMHDLESARQIATYLLEDDTNWQDWFKCHPDNIMTDGVENAKVTQELRHFLTQYPDLIPQGMSRFITKLQSVLKQEYSGRSTAADSSFNLRMLLLWNIKNLSADAIQIQRIKTLVCQNIQNVYEHPVWAEDGSWGYNPYTTASYIRSMLSFWEYYLLGGETPDKFFEVVHPGTGW